MLYTHDTASVVILICRFYQLGLFFVSDYFKYDKTYEKPRVTVTASPSSTAKLPCSTTTVGEYGVCTGVYHTFNLKRQTEQRRMKTTLFVNRSS